MKHPISETFYYKGELYCVISQASDSANSYMAQNVKDDQDVFFVTRQDVDYYKSK